MDRYEPYILNLQTKEGYQNFYWQMLIEYNQNCQEAFEATERTYERYFGKNRYADLNSFRAAMYREKKKKKKSP